MLYNHIMIADRFIKNQDYIDKVKNKWIKIFNFLSYAGFKKQNLYKDLDQKFGQENWLPAHSFDGKVISRYDGFKMYDEAYYEFSGLTCADLINKFPNLIITRTFSKAFGLAGLRAGYLISNKRITQEILKVKSPYDLNIMAANAASAALNDIKSMKSYVKEVMQKSKPELEKFLKKNNMKFYPSRANFLFVETKDPMGLFNFLKKNKILVRPLAGRLRITVGTLKETKILIKSIKKYLSK